MISVIIPIFNAEQTLDKCLASVANQDFTDFEVILVNDGSTDNSESLCRKWVTKDSRFHLLSQSNGGVSSARNNGINHAKGEFICFVDSDDYVDQQYLSTLYNGLISHGADISLCSIYGNNKVAIDVEFSFNSCSEIVLVIAGGEYGTLSGPYNKLFKVSILRDLRFNEQVYLAEDNLFCVQYAKRCKKGFFVNKWLYHYDNTTSTESYMRDPTRLDKYLTYADAHELMLKDVSMLNDKCRIFLKNAYFQSIQTCYYQSRYFHNSKAEKAMLNRMRIALQDYPLPHKAQWKPYTWWIMAHLPRLFPLWNAMTTRI